MLTLLNTIKGKFNLLNAFGIELELLIPRPFTQQDVVRKLSEASINVRGLGWQRRENRTTDQWIMTSDCTVRGQAGYSGSNELVSPKLYGQDGKNQLKQVLKVLNEMGCIVNKSCGLHVHHDVTDVMLLKQDVVETFLLSLVKLVAKYEHIIYRLVSPSRLMKVNGSYWTKPVRKVFAKLNRYDFFNIDIKRTVKLLKDNCKADCNDKYDPHINRTAPFKFQDSRYCGLNLKNIWTRGSVEFRYHQGSLNFDKIWAWVVFTQLIVSSCIGRKVVSFSKVQTNEHGLFNFRKTIGMIGHKNQCPDVKFANKMITKRFKKMTTSSMNISRSRSGLYYTIKNQFTREA